ncbi:MAG: SDR family oxidoreductase [Bacteroidetes bacterium]|nr:MAG: SDR family oxidoreductase [Bacteroidota bacterium]
MLTVITGASKGIGKAIAEKFASQGFNLALCARTESDLLILKNEIESKFKIQVHILSTDVSKKSEVEKFANFVQKLNEKVAVLINNAGVFVQGQVHNEAEGILETMINTNLYSAYYLTKALILGMIEQKKGHIFNICSIASIMPYANGGSYSISKYAMYGMTKVLREEMKPLGIRVTAILPGATLTNSWSGSDLPSERFIKSEDVAEAVFSAYHLSENSVIEEMIIRPQLGDI